MTTHVLRTPVSLLASLACATALGAGDLLVSSDFGHEVLRYDAESGDFVDVFVPAAMSGGLNQPHGILALGGSVLVASFGTDQVMRYDRASGAFGGVFIGGADGLSSPVTLRLGPDGALYVASQGSDEVHRYDAATGAFIDVFVAAGSGGLDGPSGMVFGADGRLYVAGRYSANVIAYDAATGAFDEVVLDVADGLTSGDTFGIAFDSEGDLYVASGGQVLRADVAAHTVTGSIGVASIGLVLGPDGALYAARGGANQIARIDPVADAVTDTAFLGAGAATPNLVNFFHFAPSNPADLNGDGVVDTADLGILLGAFGSAGGAADLNNDGVVDTADLGILLAQFGAGG
ncbi:MAG: hypothetical protein H6813_01320 [Phycisphaeraceae bacterium]|nr:hypothetical protein [Phycisphaeraceae bacterium]MCB9847273.1 hypothetical protein [Phycisphaeraceae bacterium]